MAQDWYTPQTMPAAALPMPLPAMHELRPLSLGEILDRTFAIYRSRFWLFCGIAAIYSVTALAVQLLNLLVKHYFIKRYGFQSGSIEAIAAAFVTIPLLLFPLALTQAGSIHALSEVYLGNGTTAVASIRAVAGRWYRYLGIAIWISFSAVWLPALLWAPAFMLIFALKNSGLEWLAGLLFFLGFCATPYSVWALLRNSLGVQASVVENATMRTAMRRTKILTVGAKGRVFVVLLIVMALAMTVGVLQMPLMIVVVKAPLEEHTIAEAIGQIVNALAQTVVTPVGLIALSLVYFDQRVRQEGFDLLMMLGPGPADEPVRYAEPALDAAGPIGSDGL